MNDKPNDLTTIPAVSEANITTGIPKRTKETVRSGLVDKVAGAELDEPAETIELTHDSPGAVRGAFTLNRYKPDGKGVIVVDVRDAETLKQKWGWRDA